MAERFSFYDNDTGDIIQSGENGPIDGFPSASRAMASLDSATSTQEGNDMFDIIRQEAMRGKSIFGLTREAKFDSSAPLKFETTSPCLGKPRILAPTHIYAKRTSYHEVKGVIDRALEQRTELAFSTFPKNQMVGAAYFNDSI